MTNPSDSSSSGSEIYRPFYERWWEELKSRSAAMNRRTLAWTALGLAAAILLSVNLLAATSLKNWKADLTQDRLFTIADGTREILKSVDEPITVRLYFSRRLTEVAPEHVRYFQRVRALMEQYRDLSGGKLVLEIIDPEPFSDAEDRVVAAGLQGIRLNAEGEVGYFGLVARNSTDDQEVIPFFSPSRESFLEYDVTKLVYNLANPKKRVVGLMTALPLEGGEIETPMGKRPQRPWLIMSQIREFFDVRTVGQDVTKIPEGLDVLMVVQPTGLTEQAAYAIDQYALNGGRVLVFLDPVAETAQLGMLKDPGEGRRRLAQVLKGWGVDFDSSKVAGDIRHARRVQFGGDSNMVTEFIAWLGLDKRNINASDVLSAGIEVINVASSGYFTRTDGAKVDFQPIIETSSDAMSVDAAKMGFGADPLGLLRSYVPGGKKLTLAARLSGDVPSAFPAGKPGAASEPAKDAPATSGTDKPAQDQTAKPAETAKPDTNHRASGTINAIIVADSDLLADQFWVDRREMMGQEMVMPSAHNAAFVVGALENLSGSDALIALRGRGVADRPFTWVQDLRRNAERQFREKEQALEAKLKATQDELQKLQVSAEGGSVLMSEKEREAAEKFRSQILETRRELREVKRALRSDIDRLDGWLKFANIALVPLLIAVGGLGWTLMRSRQSGSK